MEQCLGGIGGDSGQAYCHEKPTKQTNNQLATRGPPHVLSSRGHSRLMNVNECGTGAPCRGIYASLSPTWGNTSFHGRTLLMYWTSRHRPREVQERARFLRKMAQTSSGVCMSSSASRKHLATSPKTPSTSSWVWPTRSICEVAQEKRSLATKAQSNFWKWEFFPSRAVLSDWTISLLHHGRPKD